MDPRSNPENVFNILIASDVHLGYGEKDPLRGMPSLWFFKTVIILYYCYI